MTTTMVHVPRLSPIDQFRVRMRRVGVAATITAAHMHTLGLALALDDEIQLEWPDAQVVRWSDDD